MPTTDLGNTLISERSFVFLHPRTERVSLFRSDPSKRGKSLLNKPAYAAICSAFGFLGPVLGLGFDGGNAGGGSSTFISSLCKIIDR
jgi:hypothetical protein